MSHEWSDGGAEARRTRRRARRQELVRRRRLGAAVTLGAVVVVAGAAAALEGGPATRSAGTGRPASTTRGGAGSRPFDGRLLIADRGNNRLLLVDAAKHVLWRYPARGRPAPRGGFYFPDDAFFVAHGTGILSNEEDNHTIVRIGFPDGRLQWSYGHPRHPGSSPGYLDQPDDAYLLSDGRTVVADAKNCRILILSARRRPIGQIGRNGSCVHDPPRTLGYPNGDTPLANGHLLISEINGSWITEMTLTGRLLWTVHLPLAYPSDPQQLGPDRYLAVDYHRPGSIVEFTRAGHIVWRYRPVRGPGMLDHPSLAERLPNGLIAVNDDYRHRVALIDPASRRIVWQYGLTDRKGSRTGLLNTPDGFDLLAPNNRTPTHPQTG